MPRYTPLLPTAALFVASLAAAPAISVAHAQAPANDEPAAAAEILIRRSTARFRHVTTVAATKSLALPCTAGVNDDDVFFAFAASGPGLQLEYRDLVSADVGAGIGYAVLDAATDEVLACDYRLATGPAGGGFVDLDADLTVGRDYVLALFTGAPGGGSFRFRLTAHELPLIAENPGGDCVTATVDLDGSGGRVDALAPDGSVLASLGNEEALGRTTVTVRGHRGASPREGSGFLVYDRNVTVTPSKAPAGPVAVDFYVTAPEMLRLARAADAGRGFGEYAVMKSPATACSPSYVGGGGAVPVRRVFDYPGGYRLALEVTDFAELFLRADATILPVELIAFEAAAAGDVNRVSWRVSDEIDLARYVLERSGRAGEPDSWHPIAEVTPRGGAEGEVLDYVYEDAAPLPTGYYRLRQVDTDGSEAVSAAVVVERGDLDGAIALFPNPAQASGVVTVEVPPRFADATVSLRDVTGREIGRFAVDGRRALILPTATLAAGTYAVEIATAEAAVVRRLIVR